MMLLICREKSVINVVESTLTLDRQCVFKFQTH